MKREIIFLTCLFLLIFSLSVSAEITGKAITGETVHGKATQGVGMNITVTGVPALTIVSPKNHTYLNNHSVPLNYSVSGEQAIWYSLDSGTNITITSSLFFNASDGDHKLFLYANNSGGDIATKSVNFSVNPILFNLSDDEWEEEDFHGVTTNFTVLSFLEIQNLSNITFEHTSYGKILFNQNINLTNDEDEDDDEIDLETYINISSKRIELNSTALPNFDKQATLWLYGLTFTDPRILIDGEACPSAICKEESYAGGTLKFNVTGFTVYSVDETPTATTVTVEGGVVSSGGGGSGGGIISEDPFKIEPDELKIYVKQGQVMTKNIVITNNRNQKTDFWVQELKIGDLLLIREENFTLDAKESKIISFDIFAKEDTLPKLYLGKIYIKSSTARKEVLVAIEVESKEPLFDVKAEIPNRFKYILPGEELFAQVSIYNLGEIEKEVDVLIEYSLMDSNGDEVFSDSESLAVYTKLDFLKSFKIPEDAPFGKYVLYIKTTYDDKIGSASAWFNVGATPTIPTQWAITALLIIIILALIFIIITIRKIKKEKPIIKNRKVDDKALKRANIIKRGR